MENFGKIKNAFNGILAEGVVRKNVEKKTLFKKYIKTIKESNILKTQFLVYTNIENKIETDQNNANIFVTENLKLLEKFKVSDIIKENKKLIDLSKEVEEKLSESYDSTISKLHESLSILIATKRNPNNIDAVTENINNVVTYMKNNKAKEINEKIDLPMSMITNLLVDKYNEKYDSLDENDKKVLKTILESNDEQKKEVYSNTLKECIELINEKLKTSDLVSKEKLLAVKEKCLNDKQEVNENFISNISKLVELKSTLKTNV